MAATKRKNMNPRIERKITRISGVREMKQTFLIICEGVNTEPALIDTKSRNLPLQQDSSIGNRPF